MARKPYTGRGGPNDRRLRYPVKLTIKISDDALATLEKMAHIKDTTVATLGRRAIMKDVYIYKAEQKLHVFSRALKKAREEFKSESVIEKI